ncbi:MAG: glycine--tRNA ligase subunit beta [Candidatus Nitrohelix vancouverensis]|uniref:Glycine--tRNA ligase beta subunit n=1 Tax=Candidatus Nitrohelix vancouverensis TaxID=2705534 RepID=A0A7T0C0Z3_9BACT|nr:MAG: glycine--tRNA ligase subunit beta [Candidatus Nitrohelix vancouverensis]
MEQPVASDLFIEIGSEEIPSGYVRPALNFLDKEIRAFFEKNKLTFADSQVFGTPRRLAIHFSTVQTEQKDEEETLLGPSVQAAFDDAGKPTRAAQGFARSKGIDPEDLQIVDSPKGKVIAATVKREGQATQALLEAWLPQLIKSIPFPKKMRWADNPSAFARPLHWIVSLFGDRTLKINFDGVRAGNQSRGHRFLAPQTFTVENLASYQKQCREHRIIADPNERKQEIERQVRELATAAGGQVEPDDALLEEVNQLVEYPFAILGNFEAKYLELPKELLSIVMKRHQRYFPVASSKGELLNHFITISNIQQGEGEEVRKGNERVIRARLDDASFFYKEDRKKPLADFVDALNGVVFQKKLGTSYEKMTRIASLAEALASAVSPEDKEDAIRAARLCKADLVTQMVYEFPELQGIMGGYYARHSGENDAVSQAVKDHYKPAFAGDSTPETSVGAIIALADKLDTILGCIGVGLIPSGSEDPYGLRRHALGIIQIIQQRQWSISLNALIDEGLNHLDAKIKLTRDEIRSHVLDLFAQRYKSSLKDEGFPYDAIDAVLASGIDALADVQAKVRAFSDLKQQAYFEDLSVTFRRVVSILDDSAFGDIDSTLLKDPVEIKLHQSWQELKTPVRSLVENKQFSQALEKIVEIKPSVDAFFDGVMVMDKDLAIRSNRLRLLRNVSLLFSDLADFSRIVFKKG